MVNDKVEILCITETKLDASFPTSCFIIQGFSVPYRRDRTRNGGGILVYVRSDIPSKEIPSLPNYDEEEHIFIEITLFKVKWIIGNIYNPCKNNILRYLKELGKNLDHFYLNYDNVLLHGDFNSEVSENGLKEFSENYNLKNLVKESTCFKNYENPSCIDLILTNRIKNFQKTTTIETGLSDCHKMTATVLKSYFKKKQPKIVSYRDYKRFSNENFQNELNLALHPYDLSNLNFDTFENIFMGIFDKHVPIKLKYLRANDSPFMNKELRKQVMLRSRLKNKCNKEKTESSRVAYKAQRNKCTSLLRKAKINFYSNLKSSSISNTKMFWKTVKPFFSNKNISNENMTLIDNNQIISDDCNIAETFSHFFNNAVKNLDITIDQNLIHESENIDDPICKAIAKYQNHPSIVKIKEMICNSKTFEFTYISANELMLEIKYIDCSKSDPIYSIPSKIIKENLDFFTSILHDNLNNSIYSCLFPNKLKLADITPTYKKGGRNEKGNYRPISILPCISKIYEKILYRQLYTYFDHILSVSQCGFRKGFSAQHCIIVMLEKWKKSVDKKGSSGVLLTDLSKAFDCLSHELLIAKLEAYGLSYSSLKFIDSYLRNRFQRVRVNSSYSKWSEILSGVPQGSILGPLIFNIYLCDLFFCLSEDIANYADDNSPYATEKDIDTVIKTLEGETKALLNWLNSNYFKANPDKSSLLLSSANVNLRAVIDGHEIFNSEHVNLLGITLDNGLKLNDHVSKLCKKASQKVHALARVSRYMDIGKKRQIMKAFIESHFNYCPLVWMFHSRSLNTRINQIHERALRIVYGHETSSFANLLKRDNSFTIHERNIQTLAIEVFKVVNGISPEIMKSIFPLKVDNRYHSKQIFETQNIRTVHNGTDTLSFLGPKIWGILPNDIKTTSSLIDLKKKIRLWKPKKCPCRLCKRYIQGVGYIEV